MFTIKTKKKSHKLHFNDVPLTTITKEMMYSGIDYLLLPQTVNCVSSHCVNSDKISVQVAMITMPYKLLIRLTHRKKHYPVSVVLTKTK